MWLRMSVETAQALLRRTAPAIFSCAARAAAIFLDEPYNFNRVAELMRRSIAADVTEWGQHFETCRDIPHGVYHSAQLVDIPEMLWHQGVDVYSVAGHRLARAIEFHAALTLGRKNEVYALNSGGDWGSRCSIWDQAWECADCSPSLFEIGYNHFNNRLGMPMPYTAELLAAWRPLRRVSDPGYGFTLAYPGSGRQDDPLSAMATGVASGGREAVRGVVGHAPYDAVYDLRGRPVAAAVDGRRQDGPVVHGAGRQRLGPRNRGGRADGNRDGGSRSLPAHRPSSARRAAGRRIRTGRSRIHRQRRLRADSDVAGPKRALPGVCHRT